MTEDLLAKEKEFHRINRELELKTRDLMKDVDSVINIHGNESSKINRPYSVFISTENTMRFSENLGALSEESSRAPIKRNASSPQISDESLFLKPVETQADSVRVTLSKKENNSANKAMVNFLKTKIDILQNELQTIRLEYKKKCDYCKDLEVENKKLGDQKAKLQNEIETAKDVNSKLENTNNNLNSHSQDLTTENSILKRDLEGLKKEIKLLHQQSSNYDMRLNRSLETNEKLRNAIKCSHIEEKELRNQIRRLQEDKNSSTKNLEKQRSELVHAFKKQMLLIDNLKRQNACLTAAGQIQFTEEEFSRLLDQKPDCL